MRAGHIVALAAAIGGCLAAARVDAGEPEDRKGKLIVPESATEGARDAAKSAAVLGKAVDAQPFGKAWKEIVHVDPAPKDRTGTGEADTHPALKNDPIELQQQAQYLEETGKEDRFGFASVRVVRVYRYGKLAAARLVIEMIDRDSRDKFKQDVEALADAWKDPVAALGLTGKLKLRQNDLIEQKVRRPAEFPVPPLVIELVPVERGGAR